MRVSVFGLGYVGTVTAGCIANNGNRVLGVDVSAQKVGMINAGESPIVEEGISEIVARCVSDGRLRATDSAEEAVRDSEVALVSVGTPTKSDGAPEMSIVEKVVGAIGRALRGETRPYTVVVRSTVVPGWTHKVLAPLLEEESGRSIGDGLNIVFNPEFLREGSSVKDFYNPPFTLSGCDAGDGHRVLRALYGTLDAPFYETGTGVAESTKILSNAFHALKISFANEVGRLLHAGGVDPRAAMDIFVRDTQLNISKAYLSPGFAFGGSCLPKDLRAILSMARQSNVELPVLASVLQSNACQVEEAMKLIAGLGERDVALIGLAFKRGTDDLRESPYVSLAERLVGKGYRLRIFDPFVRHALLVGANRAYVERELPHFEELLVPDLERALDGAGTIVVAHASQEELAEIARRRGDRTVVDLGGSRNVAEHFDGGYKGLCW